MIKATKTAEIKRSWHLVDADGQVLGRLATKITPLLMGKNKPYFVRNLDCGDYVVLINAKKVKITGKKETQEKYLSYSGYPGGLKSESLGHLKERNPQEMVKRTVSLMLPKNKLRQLWLNKLFVFGEEKHTYEDKFKK